MAGFGVERRRVALCVMSAMSVAPSCTRESSKNSQQNQGVVSASMQLPEPVVIPSYRAAMKKEIEQVDGKTFVNYVLGDVYPAEDFIKAVRSHLTSIGWRDLGRVPADWEPYPQPMNQWFVYVPQGPLDKGFEMWWKRDRSLVTVHLFLDNKKGDSSKVDVVSLIVHYDSTAAAESFPIEMRTSSDHESHPVP